MKVVFHQDFYSVYTSDPAAAAGRMEAIVEAVPAGTEWIEATPADESDIAAAHTPRHIENVKKRGLYQIAALAAGGAVQAAEIGLTEPCFGIIRPPGHHASADSAWGFCYFNNMAVALLYLKRKKKIDTALVLDFDLHYGDGNINILEKKDWVDIYNPQERDRNLYLRNIGLILSERPADIIGISAGFDHHKEDWGGLLETEDYFEIGRMVRDTASTEDGGCFAVLEGGYNHDVLGRNAAALMRGLSE